MNIQAHGTFIIAIICRDGILMASDSRSAFTLDHDELNEFGRKKHTVYAYYDNSKKIFPIGNFQIGFIGVSMMGNKYFSEITSDFSKKQKDLFYAEETFEHFINYLKNDLNIAENTIYDENQYIIAGYENECPVIFGHAYTGAVKNIQIGGAIYSDLDFKPFLTKPNDVGLYCKDLAPYLEANIRKYAIYKNDNMIGGPFYIIQINPDNSTTTIKQFKPYYHKTYKEMAELIFRNEIKMTYLFQNSKELLFNTLIEGIKLGY
ncbi:hypothetical protein GCM10027275_14710 [Rhabdobacter roseus]|uniref:Uncharacterized protein n=1 Tax=Rhabdobacter roseus TaxID=1655419 RepID=A0A840TTR9_9BACT|nr:hypothetical protein [Rhabdobacter roseus]MBB5283390.1 hypothetical protein [Rhabdobacter roseus]